MGRFGSVITAMVTPFDADGAIDLGAAEALAAWLVDQGNDGLVLAGTTGESPVLTDEERVELWRAVRGAVDVPIIAGSGTNDTPHTVHMTKAAAEVGCDAVLVVTPYYNRPGQAGIEAHMRAAAGASELPVIVYDIPVRTGRKIAHDTLLRLAEVGNIVGLKDAAGNPGETARVIAEAGDEFEVYSGDDALTLPLLAVGAVGVIGVATHWAGPQHRSMLEAWQRGDAQLARRLNEILLPSYAFETGDAAPNPIPAKAMLRTLGHAVGECRLPMGPAPAGLTDEAEAVYAALQSATPNHA